jgi:hypothetical protein
VQLQEKCQQYSRLAQDLQITSDEALDFEFKLRERESYLESEIQVCLQDTTVVNSFALIGGGGWNCTFCPWF